MATRAIGGGGRFHWNGERLFFGGMGLLILALVFAGFAPSFFLRDLVEPYRPLRPMGPLVIVHGIAFTAWLLLFIVQGGLISARQHKWHKRLGFASLGLAVVMVVLGLTIGIQQAARGAAPPGMDPLSWMWISLLDMTALAGLVAAGFAWRHRPQVHKRLMLFATMMMLAPALSRLPMFQGWFFNEAGVVAALSLGLAVVAWDLASRGRVMIATIAGIGVMAADHVVRVLIWNTDAARAVAGWIVGLFY